jgi:hypothetical protein
MKKVIQVLANMLEVLSLTSNIATKKKNRRIRRRRKRRRRGKRRGRERGRERGRGGNMNPNPASTDRTKDPKHFNSSPNFERKPYC